jgi:hypothetical protein
MMGASDLSLSDWRGTPGESAEGWQCCAKLAAALDTDTDLSACIYALRLHSGTYCKETDTGGSNGAGMRYESEGGDPASE